MPSMTFILDGRDHLSRLLDRAGDASDRLGRRLLTTSINGDAAMRRLTDSTSRRLAGLQRDSEAGGKALEELKKSALLLAPAAIPAAAALAPLAAGAGTVAVATLAMTAAIIPQIGALSDAAEAEKKYEDAVKKSGARSQEAITAHTAYIQSVSKLPPETRKAAAALGVLKDSYKEWSNSLAGDTMARSPRASPSSTRLLPKTTGLVKVTSAETDRFMTIVGGEMASPGLDRLNGKFTSFAQKTLRNVNDEIVHLLRTGNAGEVGGKAREFMDWAKAQGPTVASVLMSVATALIHVLDGASGVGVGLLQVVEVAARLVGRTARARSPSFLQLALALKPRRSPRSAWPPAVPRSPCSAGSSSPCARRPPPRPARLAAARAAITALSTTAKVAVAGTGIGLLVVLLTELSQNERQAPPDVDKLTNSLRNWARPGPGHRRGVAAFGKDLDGLHDKVKPLTDPSTTDKVQQFLVGWTGWDSTPVKDAKENIDAIDKSLAGLVSERPVGPGGRRGQAADRRVRQGRPGHQQVHVAAQRLQDASATRRSSRPRGRQSWVCSARRRSPSRPSSTPRSSPRMGCGRVSRPSTTCRGPVSAA
jgi:hypothetical protein